MDSIWINDREYFFYKMNDSKYVLVSNYENIYDGDIIEVEFIDNNIRMKQRRFDKKVLEFVIYLEQHEDDIIYKYYSKQKQNFYAGDFEQKDYYYITFIEHKNNEKTEKLLKLKRDGARPFRFRETNEKYVFVDKDGDEFKITSRAIGEAKQIMGFLYPSLNRLKTFLKELNGKQKKI